MTTYDSLHRIFNAKSIALVGVSNRAGNVGQTMLRNIVEGDYAGVVYPVNPHHQSVMGMRVYPSLQSIPDPVDLAIMATPSPTIPRLIEECGACGIPNALIVSTGFLEAGKQGTALFRQVARAGKRALVRIIGPNCLGFIRPSIGLNASVSKNTALPGRLAFISQSGALCAAVLDWSRREKLGFSHFISIGAMADIGYHDLIDYLGRDPETASILIYMESLKDARRFISAARAIGKRKPIVVLKAGRSSEGAAAVATHTGNLSGDDATYDAVFRRAGVARVKTVKELFNVAQTLPTQPAPKSNRLIMITNAGAPAVIATDAHAEQGGQLACLSRDTQTKLDALLPPASSHGNPIYLLGDADASRYREAFRICLADDNADGIILIVTPQALTQPHQIGKAIAGLERDPTKTVLAVFMGADDVARGTQTLKAAGIPVYDSPEEAVTCFNLIASYGRNQAMLAETPDSIPAAFQPKIEENRALLEAARAAGRSVLGEQDARHFIANYGIESPPHALATSPNQAAKLAAELGFPVALKIASPDILHKTDVGGIVLNIRSQRAAASAYRQLAQNMAKAAPEARIDGVLVEKMVSKRYELFVGSKKDPLFGPVVVFGMGGVGVEVFNDISIGLPPLNMALAKRMIEDTRIYQMLKGYRGIAPVDLTQLQFLLYRFSYMVAEFPELQEVDINPIAVDESGILALDAKIVIDPTTTRSSQSRRYPHLVITPYPKHWEKRVNTRDGRPALLRAIRPEDEPMEAELFRTMSEETQRFRFFQLIKDITHEVLVQYTQIDYDREIAVIAEIEERDSKKMAGVARIIGDPYNETAEFAVVVTDPYQGQGLGTALTDHVLQLARRRRLSSVYAHFLSDNYGIRRILQKRGFVITEKGEVMKAEKRFSGRRSAS